MSETMRNDAVRVDWSTMEAGATLIAYRCRWAGRNARLVHVATMEDAPGWGYGYMLARPLCGLVSTSIRNPRYEPAATADAVTCKRCRAALAALSNQETPHEQR